jgi:hypothetical protein
MAGVLSVRVVEVYDYFDAPGVPWFPSPGWFQGRQRMAVGDWGVRVNEPFQVMVEGVGR